MGGITIERDGNGRSLRESRLLDAIARSVVLKVLSKISCGSLLIEEGGQVWRYGEPYEQASVNAQIFIHHPSVYRAIMTDGSIGAGEAFMHGGWSTNNLLDVVRVFVLNLELLNALDRSRIGRFLARARHLLNANTLLGSRRNIAAHYDLGNDFFRLFLDPTMMYSSAIYPSDDCGLDEAALFKLDVICRKLQLEPGDHLLEIGTGWGGLAIHAAKHYGCRVTTTTISREQYEYASERVKSEGLQDRVTLLLQDYRLLEGSYDKLVSIEMIEAVGHAWYQTYFERCSALLKPDGLMLIQAITIADQRYEQARRSVDFIQRYIFPGGGLPSVEVLARCIGRSTDMQIVDLQDIGIDYARTLAEWRRRFHANLQAVTAMGFDDVFCRMWDFYLCYCEGGFRERAISTVQMLFAKPAARASGWCG